MNHHFHNGKWKELTADFGKFYSAGFGKNSTGVDNIAVSVDAQPENIHEVQEKRKPGAQSSHPGSYRIRKRPTERIRIYLDMHEYPECLSTLRRKGSIKRIIEVLRIRLRSDNMSMEKHLYRRRVKGGVFNPLLIPEVTIW